MRDTFGYFGGCFASKNLKNSLFFSPNATCVCLESSLPGFYKNKEETENETQNYHEKMVVFRVPLKLISTNQPMMSLIFTDNNNCIDKYQK